MIPERFVGDLRKIVGKNQVSTAGTDIELYSYDASLAKETPDLVVFPADTSQVSKVVKLAHEAGIPIVPRGFGTNLSGGTVPSAGGMVVCLSRLDRILWIYPDRRYAVVQTGVTNLELQNALAPLDFFYAPDPASQKVATFGGTVGENSGGPRCLKYGVTTNHVLGMELVLPDGEVARLGGAALDPPGYDLRGTVVGSEGTFGIATEVTVRILRKAEGVITMLAVYNDVSDAARSVSAVISAGLVPATLEMMDSAVIKAVEDSYACGYPRDAAAVLIIEVEGPAEGLRDQAETVRKTCVDHGCRHIHEAKNEEEANRLWEGRRGAFGAVARLAPSFLVNDCTVPRTRLPEALAGVAEIADKHGFSHGNVFHAGDGNLHPLMFFDSRDPDQLQRVKKAGWEIMEACVKLGGTISGEHGIGTEKMKAMRLIQTEDEFEVQRALKRAFDPRNLLNPGKIIPAPMDPNRTRESFDQPFESGVSEHRTSTLREKEIVDGIRSAVAGGKAVLPMGGGDHSDFGNACNRPVTNLSSAGLDTIAEFDPQNQVVTAGAGVSLENLQQELATRNQWLPIRPPFSHRGSSVGGLVALGSCGPERIAYGAPRDRLLGLRYIDPGGRSISAGGRVVKNVAGYDLTRLLAGSAGTLGFITEATFRIAALPERCTAVVAEGALKACSLTAAELNRSTLQPIFTASVPVEKTTHKVGYGNWQLIVGFEGLSGAVAHQLDQAGAIPSAFGLEAIKRVDYLPTVGPFQETFETLEQGAFVLRADFPLNRLLDFVELLEEEATVVDTMVDLGCGRIRAGLESMNDEGWRHICEFSIKHGGHAILEKAPADFKEKQDVFGPPRPEWKLLHSIKQSLDPGNLFSPGRLPGKR
ncbi:MAG: FAD-binding protein [Proteobacteria bacterium]|nr:FAD-binding protein [Pseudomonadota bacterium]